MPWLSVHGSQACSNIPAHSHALQWLPAGCPGRWHARPGSESESRPAPRRSLRQAGGPGAAERQTRTLPGHLETPIRPRRAMSRSTHGPKQAATARDRLARGPAGRRLAGVCRRRRVCLRLDCAGSTRCITPPNECRDLVLILHGALHRGHSNLFGRQ